MKIEIKDRWTGRVLYSGDHDDIKAAMAQALAMNVSLRGADLSGADLIGSDLSGSDLSGSDLRGADLSGADLLYANLRYADLSCADLSGSNLRDADLRDADLSGADLSDADLSGSDLRDADLRDADLSDADLTPVRADFLAEVLKLPNELEFLRDALIAGKVDGSTYSGECACLAGTLAHARGIEGYGGGYIKNGCTFVADSSSPRERFFLAIRKGDTPETNGASKVALEWTNEAIAMRDNIRSLTH